MRATSSAITYCTPVAILDLLKAKDLLLGLGAAPW